MTPLQSIRFAKPIITPDWGGDKARVFVTDTDADIQLDLDGRIAILRGRKNRESKPLIIPLENVVQWNAKTTETKPRTAPRKSSADT